jgi:hypothetical protein
VNASGGVFEKTAGTGSSAINVPIDNEGTVEVQTAGQLAFGAGGGPSTTGSWLANGSGSSINFASGTFTMGTAELAGTIDFTTGNGVTAYDLSDPGATADISGPVSVTTATLNVVNMSSGADLAVADQLNVNASLTASGNAELVGSGLQSNVTIPAGSTMTLAPNATDQVGLSGISVTNNGTFDVAAGTVLGIQPSITNNGVALLNGTVPGTGVITNGPTGLITTTAATTADVNWQLDNEGEIDVTAGNLELTGGGPEDVGAENPDPTICSYAPAAEAGTWTTSGSGSLTFGTGCYELGRDQYGARNRVLH